MAPLTAPDPRLSLAQTGRLLAVRAWWGEGERSLEYLAELGRHEATLARLQPLWHDLHTSPTPGAAHVAALLPAVRSLTGNHALSRSLETDAFARALRDLTGGEAVSLPDRVAAFLEATSGLGALTASHLLYAARPDRFPPVSPRTQAVIGRDTGAAKGAARARYGLADNAPASPALALLTQFEQYEAVRQLFAAETFAPVHLVLTHARQMPAPAKPKRAKGRRAALVVREAGEGYATDTPPAAPTEGDLLQFIEAHIAAAGFTYPPGLVRDYYVALKAKPFALLTGLSGTGKTALTRLFAHALTGGDPDQYLLLPVRPDWADSAALMGYYNLVAGRYMTTPFLRLLARAALPENRDRAYFVCLDEMNLARPEHYFSDILSAMETPDGRIPLHDHEEARLTSQVFITGSVNSDEATYPFSRKVLDRANTLEFVASRLGFLTPPAAAAPALPALSPALRQRLFLDNRVLTLAAAQTRLAALDPAYAPFVLATLGDLNDLLDDQGLQFGFRVRDEVLRYAAAAFAANGAGLLDNTDPRRNLDMALDWQIVQKVLPRITGTHESLRALLVRLEAWAGDSGFARAAAKLARMRRRAEGEGVVTFYEG